MKNSKKNIDYDKMSKKAKKEHNKQQRGDWNGIKPYTRIEPKATDYKRHPKHKGKNDYDL